jgi:hypothetical protein
MISLRTRSRADRGATLPFALVLMLICAAIAASSTLTHASAQRDAATALARERSFQAADAGIDWGLSVFRASRGVIPNPSSFTKAVDGSASFSLNFAPCNANGLDDDADADVDETDEADFTSIASTGRSGNARHTVRVIVSRRADLPGFGTAAAITSDVPIFGIDGNRATISGEDHDIEGVLEPGSTTDTYGLTTSLDPAVLAALIPADRQDQIDGVGTDPSVTQDTPPDIEALYATAALGTTVLLAPGTHTQADYGTATRTGMAVVRCDGDLHFSGNCNGAGVLLVQGDFTVSGTFEWVGIVIVLGRATVTGTGNEKIIGSLMVGEELDIQGNTDVLFSTEAVALAKQAISVASISTWIDNARP